MLTTTAGTNEISNLEEVLDTADLPEGIPLKVDKDYQSKKNEKLLKKRKLKLCFQLLFVEKDNTQ